MLNAQNLDEVRRANASSGFSFDLLSSDLRGLGNIRVRKFYPRGSVLFVEGQQARGIYVLCEGRVKVTIASAEGKTLLLRIAQPGDLLGINATLKGQPYDATVETLERCLIDFIGRSELLKRLEFDKRLYASVAQALSNKLSSVVEHTRLLFLSQSSSEKVARLLLKWSNEHGISTNQGIRINAGLTHEEIAQMICSSRETVTRVLNLLKKKHVVSLIDNAIYVHDRMALEAMVRR